jgi:hypothetical protein
MFSYIMVLIYLIVFGFSIYIGFKCRKSSNRLFLTFILAITNIFVLVALVILRFS